MCLRKLHDRSHAGDPGSIWRLLSYVSTTNLLGMLRAIRMAGKGHNRIYHIFIIQDITALVYDT